MDALRILDDIRVANPCRANWGEMTGDDRVRHCSACSRSVYNIAAMTAAEAVALIEGREGGICGRLYRRADGTVVTADCPPAAPRRRFRRVQALAIVLIALLLAWAGCGKGESPPSGPGVSLDDWVHWAKVSLGLGKDDLSAPACYRPRVIMGFFIIGPR
jgi:hypothetical protein